MNYAKHGLTSAGISINSPLNQQQETLGIEFDRLYEVQGRRAKISNLVLIGGTATASGTIATGASAVVTTNLTPSNLSGQTNLGIPFIAIYEGTSAVGSMQFYPGRGAGITSDKFRIAAGYDYAQWSSDGNGDESVWAVTIHNTTGTTANIFAVTQWKYVSNNASDSS